LTAAFDFAPCAGWNHADREEPTARKPNYRFEKLERERKKAAKKAAKEQAKKEAAEIRKGEVPADSLER
jgi:hypothetical protein